MPTGSRLVLALLLAGLASAGARAGQPAGSWTDPPARGTGVAQPEAAAPAPAPSEPRAEAPVARQATPPAARAEAPRRRAQAARREARRSAARAPRLAARVSPRVRVARREVVREMPIERRAPVPRRLPRDPFEPLPVGVAVSPHEAMADPRLDRLGSAEAAGYLVVRRRTVVYPDGRAIRIYRPAEEDLFD